MDIWEKVGPNRGKQINRDVRHTRTISYSSLKESGTLILTLSKVSIS